MECLCGRGYLLGYEGGIVMDTCTKLIARMIVATMAGKQTKEIYDQYFRERYLHVSVEEIMRAKGRNYEAYTV